MNAAHSPAALGRFQAAFSASLRPDAANGDAAPEISALLAQPAFAVYRNTVMKGCIDALEANYPAIARLVGSEWFRAAAAIHVQAEPPRDGSLVTYGAGFAPFLRQFEPAAELPYLGGVARLDRFWTEAHVAADAPPLAAEDVARVAPESLGALALLPHPAARWTWFDEQPIYSIWSRNRNATVMADGEDQELVWQGEGALLTRPESSVDWCRIGQAEVAFLDACAAGAVLADAAEVATSLPGDAPDLSALFARLLRAGAFAVPLVISPASS